MLMNMLLIKENVHTRAKIYHFFVTSMDVNNSNDILNIYVYYVCTYITENQILNIEVQSYYFIRQFFTYS